MQASTDASKVADELRQEQEHSAQVDKVRRGLESQVGSVRLFCTNVV